MRLERTPRPLARRRISTAAALAACTALVLAVALTSGAARAVVQTVPNNTAEPRISGSATQDATLSTTTGTWTGTSPITYAYQWVRCGTSGGKSDGSNCATIGGATTSAYVLGSADVGSRLRVRVTASNADGSATVASNATAVVQSSATAPSNTRTPAISGSLTTGETLHADPGSWNGTQPITLSYRWLRCSGGGGGCRDIGSQTGSDYTLQSADSGHTIRIRVTATNAAGSRNATSGPTGVVSTAPSLPAGAVKLSTGEISIPASSVPASERLVVDRVDFSPAPVRSQSTPISIRVKVKDTRGYVVRDVLVFVRSTPLVTNTPAEQRTADDGTVTYTVQPEPDFPIRNGYNVQFFVKAHRQGDPPLAGIAAYRLVQVATAS